MTAPTLLRADYSVLRMVLAEIGAMERPFVVWLAEMEAIDPAIFHHLHEGWIDRFGSRVVSTFGLADQPALRRANLVREYVPLRACMMPELIGRDDLPAPPTWFRTYADDAVITSFGFPISSQLPGESTAPIVYTRNGMLRYLGFFSSRERCLPDEAWFDQAVGDERTVPRELPHLFRLCREVLARLDPATPVGEASEWLETLLTPDTPRPSAKTLATFGKRLAAPRGGDELAFARGFVREAALVGDDRELFAVYEHPPLYRAAILSRLAPFVADLVARRGSVRAAAEAIMHVPEKFLFERARQRAPGVMVFGTDGDARRHGVRNQYDWSVPNVTRGCLAMIAAAADPDDLAWLLPLAERAMARENVGLCNRLVRTTGLIGTHPAVRRLALMRRRCRHSTMRGQLDAALGDAAAASGLTIAEAEEFAALDHGLDDRQTRREALADGHAATLGLSATGRVRLGHEAPGGAPLARLPASVRDDPSSRLSLAALKADAKALAADLAVHRVRLERSWLTRQTWSADAFAERLLGHPVLGWLARRQIWTVTGADGTTRTCLFAGDGEVLDPDGHASAPPDRASMLGLWHPLHAAEPDLVARWRRTVARLEIPQPIRQAWRETYVVTEAEHETSPDSRRHALRVLHQAQAIELARPRGWETRTLVPHMPSSDTRPWMLVVPGFGCCAELRTAGVGAQQLRGAPFTHVVTDRVRFRVVEDRGDWRRDGARRLTVTDTPIRLGDVDPVVFSEVMRDVDLLVSVAATTLDVDPEDLLLVPEIGEWRRQAGLAAVPLPPREPHFGGVARTRRELLRAILPELVPAGAVELGERHLLVHGRRHRYEIHLGSGDVLVLPFRRQLVLSRPPPPETPEPPRLVLPLHDDVRLHAIVDTILMLVRDDRLRDKTVLAQLDALPAAAP